MKVDELTVKDVMSTAVETLRRNDKLAVADELMKQGRIRHLPVLDEDGYLCGIVSQRDLFRGAILKALGYAGRAQDLMLRNVVVKEAMTQDLYTVSADTSIKDAARRMVEHKVGCLPVVEGRSLIGILTETDLVNLVAESQS
jgi:CBS domain-containing membrane protein